MIGQGFIAQLIACAKCRVRHIVFQDVRLDVIIHLLAFALRILKENDRATFVFFVKPFHQVGHKVFSGDVHLINVWIVQVFLAFGVKTVEHFDVVGASKVVNALHLFWLTWCDDHVKLFHFGQSEQAVGDVEVVLCVIHLDVHGPVVVFLNAVERNHKTLVKIGVEVSLFRWVVLLKLEWQNDADVDVAFGIVCRHLTVNGL